MKPTGSSTKKKGKAKAKLAPAEGSAEASALERAEARTEATSPAPKRATPSGAGSAGSAAAKSPPTTSPSTSPSTSPPTSPPKTGAYDARAEERRAGQAALGGLALVLVGAVVSGIVMGPALAVLVLTAGAFVACIAFFWSSLRTLLGETPLSGADAYAIGAPRAEEEQKRAVLRALKDLEFERSVGKISEDDYRRLVAHYRDEAKRLLRLLDEEAQPMRERAEVLISSRLKAAGLAQGSSAVFRQSGRKPGEREREAAADEEARELREAAADASEVDASEPRASSRQAPGAPGEERADDAPTDEVPADEEPADEEPADEAPADQVEAGGKANVAQTSQSETSEEKTGG